MPLLRKGSRWCSLVQGVVGWRRVPTTEVRLDLGNVVIRVTSQDPGAGPNPLPASQQPLQPPPPLLPFSSSDSYRAASSLPPYPLPASVDLGFSPSGTAVGTPPRSQPVARSLFSSPPTMPKYPLQGPESPRCSLPPCARPVVSCVEAVCPGSSVPSKLGLQASVLVPSLTGRWIILTGLSN